MDCDDALLRVYEYLDGELTVWRRRAITRHLDECPPCADGFVFELEIRRIVVSKCREEVPISLRRKIAEALGIVASEPELAPGLVAPALSRPRPQIRRRTFYVDRPFESEPRRRSATVGDHGARRGGAARDRRCRSGHRCAR